MIPWQEVGAHYVIARTLALEAEIADSQIQRENSKVQNGERYPKMETSPL